MIPKRHCLALNYLDCFIYVCQYKITKHGVFRHLHYAVFFFNKIHIKELKQLVLALQIPFLLQKISEYDPEIPQSHTADQPTAP